MHLILRATLIEHVADADPSKRWWGRWLEVVHPAAQPSEPRWQYCEPRFRLMCSAITSDIQSAEGSGACVLDWVRKVESGEIDFADVDGNAWVMNISRDKVWFEGLYNQGEGGEVSFAQYKLAVQTYVRFLADPEHNPIEVEFPA
jgi:hypothetical protein